MTTNNEQQVAGLTSGLNVELDPTSDELDGEPCLLIAIRHAWDGNYDQAGEYMNLAADKLEKKGRLVQAKALRDALDNLKNNSQSFCAYHNSGASTPPFLASASLPKALKI